MRKRTEVKILYDRWAANLEKDINNFLRNNPEIIVKDIKFSTLTNENGDCVFAMIVFEEIIK